MTTPLCDCPDNMGWGTQADYTTAYGTATATITNAQGIYCVNGFPVVGPRGGFRTDWTEARVLNDPVPHLVIPETPLDLRVDAVPTVTDSVITNPYPYPMQFMAHVGIVFWCTLIDDQQLTITSVIKSNGTTTIGTSYFHNQGASSAPYRTLYFNWSYPLPQLAPGASTTIGHYPLLSTTNSNGFGTWWLFDSTIRIEGGTTPPPY